MPTSLPPKLLEEARQVAAETEGTLLAVLTNKSKEQMKKALGSCMNQIDSKTAEWKQGVKSLSSN